MSREQNGFLLFEVIGFSATHFVLVEMGIMPELGAAVEEMGWM